MSKPLRRSRRLQQGQNDEVRDGKIIACGLLFSAIGFEVIVIWLSTVWFACQDNDVEEPACKKPSPDKKVRISLSSVSPQQG